VIVAKRAAGRYRSGPSREWLKTKCAGTGEFVIIGNREAPGEIEAVRIRQTTRAYVVSPGWRCFPTRSVDGPRNDGPLIRFPEPGKEDLLPLMAFFLPGRATAMAPRRRYLPEKRPFSVNGVFSDLWSERVSVLTGGAGTGKTSVVRVFLEGLFGAEGFRPLLLTAPTGMSCWIWPSVRTRVPIPSA
jgi:hypothetical protein